MAQVRLFAPESVTLDGSLRRVQRVTCDEPDCRSVLEFKVGAGKTDMNDDTIMRKARIKGWTFRRGGRSVCCPTCEREEKVILIARKLQTQPEQVKESLLQTTGTDFPPEEFEAFADTANIEAVLTEGAPDLKTLHEYFDESGAGPALDAIPLRTKAKEPPPMNDTPASAAPREPSRDEKRRVLDKLNEVYTSEEIGYAGDWSDDKVAASLSVPRAWVTSLRVEFHGENAGNENGSKAKRERDRAINELRTDMTAVERRITSALGTLAEAEKALEPIKARLAKLEAAS